MEYELDLMVYIGRFQPLHNGHINTIRLALKSARRLIILVGSHQAPLTCRNPWTSEERQNLLRESLSGEEYNRCLVAGLEDFTYNDEKWIKRVKEIVQGFNAIYGGTESRIGITGFDKDSTSYYLKMFPGWETSFKPEIEKIGATEIRSAYFGHGTILTDVLPSAVARFMVDFKSTDRYVQMAEEFEYCEKYKKIVASVPFPYITVCVDNIVVCSSHVLLIKRANFPGKGLWALPGGHINPNETLKNAALRELKEETGINSNLELVKSSTFDDPNRSPRGRVITTAFHWYKCGSLSDIKAGDDACEAKWFSLHDIYRMRSQITEDHFHIIDYFLDLKGIYN